MQAVQLILLLTLSIFASGIQAKKKKCKCKNELNLLTEMIENIEEDVTMLKVHTELRVSLVIELRLWGGQNCSYSL